MRASDAGVHVSAKCARGVGLRAGMASARGEEDSFVDTLSVGHGFPLGAVLFCEGWENMVYLPRITASTTTGAGPGTFLVRLVLADNSNLIWRLVASRRQAVRNAGATSAATRLLSPVGAYLEV